MTRLYSSVITQPFNISVVTNNGTDELRRLVAPSWVNNPGVRGSMDILQSCILTLVACIYTALHLDVPKKTTWQHLLWQKTKWVLIALFAPELAVFVAVSQLRYAWSLRSKLRKIQKEKQASNWKREADFEINLKYAFCIVMGAVRFDVHDIFSFSDLNESDRGYFNRTALRRRSVRPGPAAIIQLAERGHWIQIPRQDIDDKSKADTVQKTLVVIQVLWMVTQCIARRVYGLPLSLLEIHTIVHVVCAVFLYACWFEKPLNIQEAMIIQTQEFKGELAAMLQRHFYSELSYKMALFAPKDGDDTIPPTDVDGSPMQWVEPNSGVVMREGNVLPSGLALSKFEFEVMKSRSQTSYRFKPHGRCTGISFVLEHRFLARWDAILTTYRLEGWERLGQKLEGTMLRYKHGEMENSSPKQNVVFLPFLQELEPVVSSDWEKLFWEGGSIIHLGWDTPEKPRESGTWKESIARLDVELFSPEFIVLAAALSGLYGGVHLTIWGYAFPSYVEELMWKVSCFIMIGYIPVFSVLLAIILHVALSFNMWNQTTDTFKFYPIWMGGFCLTFFLCLGYIAARVFIVVESFLSLRQSSVGVFLSPEWVELFPHF
ncbi:hypothetical protein NW768_009624 [Fusarium equiseti]|uniref:Uncharacterized protein n=1 Tax=Fusarium equiseti TaxID=61235 RepID=A0ABQ8R319_FUSEQ|nr:hypothetical protein NW768_009624 [Fusarium equiseti]